MTAQSYEALGGTLFVRDGVPPSLLTPQLSEITLGHSPVQGAVATWSMISMRFCLKDLRHLFADQVATAPCTDCVQ